MKILLCHNYYQLRGGEDVCFEQEADLLESHGHTVMRYTRHNDDIKGLSTAAIARQTLWSRRTYRELREIIRARRPDVMHCTNTFPLISPAAYDAARREGVPVVQTLQNYRLLCPSGVFLRDGKVCESCMGKTFAWPAIRHACYRDSRAASGMVALMLTAHRLRKTWTKHITTYVAVTQFGRKKFIEGGLPAERIRVKANFILPDPGFAKGTGGYAAFVGRLAPEKGIQTLIDAWSQIEQPITLKIVGDGPLRELVRQAAARDQRIQWLGQKPMNEVVQIVGDAACLVLPSIWYEGLPRTIIESFSKGTPVIASRLGAMSEVIEHGRSGLLFQPNDAHELAEQARLFFSDDSKHSEMRRAARTEFETKYTAQRNYEILIDILRQATSSASQPTQVYASRAHVDEPVVVAQDGVDPVGSTIPSSCNLPQTF